MAPQWFELQSVQAKKASSFLLIYQFLLVVCLPPRADPLLIFQQPSGLKTKLSSSTSNFQHAGPSRRETREPRAIICESPTNMCFVLLWKLSFTLRPGSRSTPPPRRSTPPPRSPLHYCGSSPSLPRAQVCASVSSHLSPGPPGLRGYWPKISAWAACRLHACMSSAERQHDGAWNC